jgi:hypothetical protein
MGASTFVRLRPDALQSKAASASTSSFGIVGGVACEDVGIQVFVRPQKVLEREEAERMLDANLLNLPVRNHEGFKRRRSIGGYPSAAQCRARYY